MTKAFWAHSQKWAETIRTARRVLFVLDFDGTLAPLVEHPTRARLPSTIRRNLSLLTLSSDLAVVSGRSLADVRKRVGIGKIFYSGNHGLEIVGPGFRYQNKMAAKMARHTGELMRLARDEMLRVPGVHVEEKGYGVSVHYRRVRPARLALFQARLTALKTKTHAMTFHWTSGHCVWELRPRVGWDKGRALLTLWRRRGRPTVVSLGDDVTDEDMFRATVGRGLSVKVGPGKTRADLRLSGQREVGRFLAWALENTRRNS